MAKKQFKAESKRLLEMMINSIYTHKEIFLRELISNASDAMDKLYFRSMKDNLADGSKPLITREDLEIGLAFDKDARTITITDNGIGMDKDELENNLGVIAQSGSFKFKQENANTGGDGEESSAPDIDVIGQFGVGFYSAFMVAKKVEVLTKKFGEDQAYLWSSEGVDGYTVTEAEKDTNGSVITLYLKDDTEDEDYSEYLAEYKLRSLVKRYSDYIRYPIKMEVTKRTPKEQSEEDKKAGKPREYDEHKETETLNSMVPIWKKSKQELTDEQYNEYYKEKFLDYMDPLTHIHSKTEGSATYNALLYIPKKAPFDFYTKEYEKGLQLYSSGVLIMDKCADLLPDYFSFVKGLVDSEDLSLNISREMLQHDRQLKLIEKSLESTIKNELKKILNNDREKYEEFWKNFGLQIKYGLYSSYGTQKEFLQDLLMFTSSNEKKLTTLEEYKTRMKEGQEAIYFASGESAAKLDTLPQTEMLKEKGYEILYLTDNVDEFIIKMLVDYDGKEFKSVQSYDADFETEDEKKEKKEKTEQNKDLLGEIKKALDGRVKDVRISSKLRSHPVCLTSDSEVSLEMEKVLGAMPGEQMKPKADRVLEINAGHPIFDKLQFLYDNDKEKLAAYSDILYNQALLIEGLDIEDPVDYCNKVCSLMV
ncbi:MAG: molecular chaperone HtpG [Ruminiclostridium sp.]|nr:molecular chaperone HtpG [Ruminiclostridium sp.]